MGKLMLNDRCYTGSDNLLMLNDESYSGGRIANLIEKNITANGTYNASDDGADGYSEVNVDVVVSRQISYLKWRITNTRSNPAGSAVQLSEFYLYLNDVLYNWNSNVSITASLSPVSAGESIEHIIDGSVDTKYTTTQWGSSSVGQCDIVISLGETIAVDNNTAYAYATANDAPSRDPVGWTLFGSLDGSSWFKLDARDSASVPTERKTSTERFIISVGGGIDYPESWIITNNSTTMSVHTEYIDGVVSSYAVYSQPGNQSRVEGDLTIFIGESSGWLWNVTATADMTYRIYNVINGTLGDLLTATSGTVIMSGIPITGDYTYEIRRYS